MVMVRSADTIVYPMSESWYRASDGIDIFERVWSPPSSVPTVATMIAVHGLGEHISRYDEMFSFLAQSGIKTLGFDQRGFGRTVRRSGVIGYNDTYKRVMADIKDAEKRIAIPGVPHFIFGHSMGGGIVLRYAIDQGERLSGVIASAPLVLAGKKSKVSIVEYYGLRLLSAIGLSTFPIHNPVNPYDLAKDHSVGDEYKADPNVHPYVCLSTGVDIVMNGEWLDREGYKHFPQKCPLLVVHGSEDVLTDPISSKKFLDGVPSVDRTYKAVPGGYHELHNDFGRKEFFDVYRNWILARMFKSPQEISLALNDLVAASSAAAVARHGKFTVAISGGSLPMLLSAVLRTNGSVSWEHWHVFLADERCVPLDHADSNYLLIKKELLDHVPIPANQVHPIAESLVDNPKAAAEEYLSQVASVLGADEVPVFDLILLGMGPDGHTCSLFPGHPLLRETKLWVAPITDSPKPPPSRITLTLPVLNAAREVVFVTTGSGKADVLKEIIDNKNEFYPSALVKPPNGVTWFVDADAASQLKTKI